MKVLIIAATCVELAPFTARIGIEPGAWCALGAHRIRVGLTGVGPVAAAFGIQRLAAEVKPALIVQAGICGAYAGAGLAIGQTVEVGRERLADLGAMRDDRFETVFDNGPLDNPYRLPGGYPRVAGFTAATAASPLAERWLALYPDDRAAVETMEGYALFYVCGRLGIPFGELRAVSNRVGGPPDEWDIPAATAALAGALTEVLDKL